MEKQNRKKVLVFISIVLAVFSVATTALAVFGSYSLSISAESTEVEVGKTTKINFTINNLQPPAKSEDESYKIVENSVSAEYTSSDSSIATVDEDGTVTGVSTGSVTIEVAVTFRDSKTYRSCNLCSKCGVVKTDYSDPTTLTGEISINVIPRNNIWMDDFTIYQTGSGTIHVQYPADYTGSKDGTWSVADPAIASVDQTGLVTGLTPGETNAQFYLTETGQIITCQISVEPLFTLSPTDVSLIAMAWDVPVNVTYSSLYTGEKSGTWSNDNEELVAVDADGTVHALKNASGSATLRYTDTATGLSGDVSVTVSSLFDIAPSSATVKIGSSKKFTVSFNPIINYMDTGDAEGVWSVGNRSVASINQNGTVTGKRAGHTVVTYTFVLGDTTFTATANVTVLCTVTFNPNDGSPTPDTVYVKKNRTISAPADPTRNGYSFLGWYTASEGGEKWDFANDKVTGSMSLYARWQAIRPQIAAPTITGPDTIILYTGYGSTDQAYGFEGSELQMYGIDQAMPNTANATLSGAILTIPEGLTEDGSPYTVTLTASNRGGTVRKTITVTVNPIGIVISPEALPDGVDGILYSATITATGGPSPFTYAVTAGSLPSGLSLDSNTGIISGTPGEFGDYNFTVTATNSLGNTGTKGYTITIDQSMPTIAGPDAIVLYAGYSSTDQVYDFEGSDLQTYGIDPAMPNTANAMFSGMTLTIPEGLTEEGSPYRVTLTASNVAGTVTKTITVTVNPIAISISPEALPAGVDGSPYSATITATGGPSPFTYAVSGGSLPPGLSLASDTGMISGTPNLSGGYYAIDYTFTVTATDGFGNTGTKGYTITINPSIGLMYSYFNNVDLSQPGCALQAFGGMGAPYRYVLAAGSAMPGGLILHEDGSMTGTLPAVGTYYVNVVITDCENNSATDTFEIEILDL